MIFLEKFSFLVINFSNLFSVRLMLSVSTITRWFYRRVTGVCMMLDTQI